MEHFNQAPQGTQEAQSLTEQAARVAITVEWVSPTFLQRKLWIGYAKACKLVDRLIELNYLSRSECSHVHQVIANEEKLQEDMTAGRLTDL